MVGNYIFGSDDDMKIPNDDSDSEEEKKKVVEPIDEGPT